MIVLKDKGKNSKIYIPRTKITNVTGGNNTTDLTDYYTKEEVDELIENVEVDLSDYYTKEEIDDIVENTTIPYLVINKDWNGYESGDFESVRQAIINKKPFSIYIPSVLGGYLTPNAVDTFGGQITLTYVYHTNGTTMYYGRCYLHSDSVKNTVESVGYATSEQLAKQGVYSLILYYDEALREYTFSGVSFSSIYSRIENKEKQYAIYLPSSDNKYMVEAQEIVIDGDVIKCKTIENNGTTQTITNWTIGEDEEGFEYYRKGATSTINIATQEWIEQQGFLTSIPDEYITESELETKLEEVDFSLPTVKINFNTNTYEGDIEGVVDGILNNKPVNVLMHRNSQTYYSATQFYITPEYIRTYCYYNSDNIINRVYTQINRQTYSITSSTNTKVPVIVDNLTSTSTTSVLSANQGRVLNETKQDTLVSGTNIKTINGESILGEGNIEIGGSEGGSDIPYVVIEYKNAMTLVVISGDLQRTLTAAKNKQPFLAYFYNTYNMYGMPKNLYPFTYVYVGDDGATLRYHTEVGSSHKDITVMCEYDTETQEYTLDTLGTQQHQYITNTELTNKGYATTTYVDTQIGNINTILENIIG